MSVSGKSLGVTGTRIRERRKVLALKQADLARRVGISPSYLNLIEHNKRKIGGKLLIHLARALEVEPSVLSEGPQFPILEGLQDAALRIRAETDVPKAALVPELSQSEEFVGRFPGWAALVVAQKDRIAATERQVAALQDRLAHDPYLSDALHEVLSTVTAIRSTAGILNGVGEIDPEWQARFHRNLYEDSQRLSEGAQALVRYLDTVGRGNAQAIGPLEELESWLAARDFVIAELERGEMPDLRDEAGLRSEQARRLARDWLLRARAEAERMPLARVEEVIAESGPDPAALARALGVDLATAMRRLASLPVSETCPPMGVVICDGSGALRFRKPLDGFAPPRFGAACPLWPLYQALLRPMMPVRRVIEHPGAAARRFVAYAICQPREAEGFGASEVVEATMLFVPAEHAGPGAMAEAPLAVGTSCRVCPRSACIARREPSMVADDL